MGIIGDPIAHSLSPRMHNAAFAARGLPWVYLAFRVRAGDLSAALRGLSALGFAGCNVTIPHKTSVLPLLDAVDPDAQRIGAVNTIRVEGGRLRGFNTDAPAVVDALHHDGGAEIAGSRCLVLGAGGAGRAAAFALARAGAAQVVILNRTEERVRRLAVEVSAAVSACDVVSGRLDPGAVARAVRGVDVVVQATSATMSAAMGGSGGRAMWLDALREGLRGGMAVLDMVYTPRWTEVLQAARDVGARPVSGLSMLVYQGAGAFTLWTGQPAPVDVMRGAVDAEVPDRG